MARFAQPTKEQLRGWKRWVAKLPPAVRVVAERFDLWSLYRMKSTDQRVTVPPARSWCGAGGPVPASARGAALVAETPLRRYMKGEWVSLAHGDSLGIGAPRFG